MGKLTNLREKWGEHLSTLNNVSESSLIAHALHVLTARVSKLHHLLLHGVGRLHKLLLAGRRRRAGNSASRHWTGRRAGSHIARRWRYRRRRSTPKPGSRGRNIAATGRETSSATGTAACAADSSLHLDIAQLFQLLAQCLNIGQGLLQSLDAGLNADVGHIRIVPATQRFGFDKKTPGN